MGLALSGLSGNQGLLQKILGAPPPAGVDLSTKSLLYAGPTTGDIYPHVVSLFGTVTQTDDPTPALVANHDITWISSGLGFTASLDIAGEAKPVVHSQPSTWEEWDLQNGSDDGNGTSGLGPFTVVGSHPAMAGFTSPLNLLTNDTGSGRNNYIDAAKALPSGTIGLEANNGDAVLMFFEAGALDDNSVALPAKRVLAPWQGETNLTQTSLDLIESICEWCLS